MITIIAILASMLLPALNQAKETAKAAACMANLRQIAAGAHLYMADYDQRLPINSYALRETDTTTTSIDGAAISGASATWNSDNGWYGTSNLRWHDAIAAYAGAGGLANSYQGRAARGQQSAFREATAVYWCPSDPAKGSPPPDSWGGPWDENIWVSTYGIPANVTAAYGLRTDGVPTPANYTSWNIHNLGPATKPEQIVFFGEGGLNFYHGRVDLSEPWMVFTLGQAAWLDPYLFSHGGRLNYVFIDGHAQRLVKPPHSLASGSGSWTTVTGELISSGGLSAFLSEFGN